MLSFPLITNVNVSSFKNNLKQKELNFKGQQKADAFEKSLNTPKLKRGQLLNENSKIFNRPDTNMFRNDLDWKDFGHYLENRFLWENKVNTYDYACSSGEEAYSLSILLQEISYNPEKFFPINAKDINNDLIEQNIQNKMGDKIMKGSYLSARHVAGLDREEIKKYVIIEKNGWNNETEKLTNKVTKPVEFSCANILDDIENIDSQHPSIIMCRNMWPYVNPKEYEDFAAKLYDKLAKGSVVVIGNYDYKGEKGRADSDTFPSSLIRAGFEAVEKSKNDSTKGGALIFEKN